MAGGHILKLLDEPDSSISIGDKRLIRYERYDGKKFFEVYQHKKYKRNAQILIQTENEQEACKFLKGE